MKMLTLFLAAVILAGNSSQAQIRYIDEIFTDITVVKDQIYGVNVTVVTGTPALDTLKFDLYVPSGDECLDPRPLVVVLHNGTFLPRGYIAPVGDKDDYGNVQICERLAKRGYVAVSIQYRKGWNPIALEDSVRRSTIINAAYRGVQDVHTFLRYINKTVAEGNPYFIDPTKVALFGLGTGAVVAFNAAVLNSESEVFIDKYRSPVSDLPYIDTLLVGNLKGTTQGLINIPNHTVFNGDFHFVFGIDGLVGDSSWIDDGPSVPLAAAGVVTHPTTPFGMNEEMTAIDCDLPVFAPTGYVVNIAGSLCIINKANTSGINDPLNAISFDDPVSAAIRTNPKVLGEEHLWGINLPGPQTGPWEYWDSIFWSAFPCLVGGTIDDCAKATNPDMSMVKANAYIDTALWFFAPRAYAVLNPETECTSGIFNTERIATLEISPNPVNDELFIRNPGDAVTFRLYNTLGQAIREVRTTEGKSLVSLPTYDLLEGIYVLAALDKDQRLIANAKILKR